MIPRRSQIPFVLTCGLLLAACAPRVVPIASNARATMDAAVAATVEGMPPRPVTVEVPVTVVVTVMVTAGPTSTGPSPVTAAPAPTAVSALTPTLEATPPGSPLTGPRAGLGPLLFADDFSHPGFWGVGPTGVSDFEILGEALVGSLRGSGWLAWTLNDVQGRDFYVQANVTVGECKPGDYYGQAFRARNDANLYFFGVSCEAKFIVLKNVNSQLATLIDLTPHEAIRGGRLAANLLGIRADGQQLDFYANDTFLAGLSDDTFSEGVFGVGLRTGASESLTVTFDDFQAWTIQH